MNHEGDEMLAIAKESEPRQHPLGNLFTPIKNDDHVTIEQVSRAMRGLSTCELQNMLALTHLLKNHTGSDAPVEQLIHDLLADYGWLGGGMADEDVEREIEQFHDNWKSTVETVEGMARRFPGRFSSVAVSVSEKAAAPGKNPDGGDAKSEQDATTEEEGPEPHTMTARLAADSFSSCIDRLTSMRLRMLETQDAPEVTALVDDLAGAMFLDEILNDWQLGNGADDLPREHGLLAAIRGNVKL
jgi:hypothetical protein